MHDSLPLQDSADGAAAAEAETKSYGVDLLWRAVSAPSGLQEDVVQAAEKSFIDMFSGRPELVQRYVIMCVENVISQKSVVKSLKLAMELLKILPISSHRDGPFATQRSAMQYLLHSFDVCNAVLKDLHRYKLEASEAARKLGMTVPCNDSVGGDAVVLVKPDTHLEAVTARLEFLGFALTTQAVDLDEAMLAALWPELVQNNVTAAEREAFFTWLESALDAIKFRHTGLGAIVDAVRDDVAAAAVACVDDDVEGWCVCCWCVCAQIFDRYMQNSDLMRFSSLGPKGFSAFEFVFRATNVSENKLRDGASLMVTDTEIIGIDALWQLAVQVWS